MTFLWQAEHFSGKNGAFFGASQRGSKSIMYKSPVHGLSGYHIIIKRIGTTPQSVIIAAKCNVNPKCDKSVNPKCNYVLMQNVINLLTQNGITQNALSKYNNADFIAVSYKWQKLECLYYKNCSVLLMTNVLQRVDTLGLQRARCLYKTYVREKGLRERSEDDSTVRQQIWVQLKGSKMVVYI